VIQQHESPAAGDVGAGRRGEDEDIATEPSWWATSQRSSGHPPTAAVSLEDLMRSPVHIRLLLLAIVSLVIAACGGSGDDTSGAAPATTATTTASGTTAAASQACADAAALKASVAELDQLDPPEAGKAGIQAALDKVRTNLAALKTSARTQWSSQLTELDSAVQALQTTIAGVDGDSLLSAAPTIVSDLQRIDTAWKALQQQIDQDCG
jgi:hypothetical protein